MADEDIKGGLQLQGLSLPRDRAERLILDCVETNLFDPKRLAEIEARYHSSRPATVDYRPRVAELERQVQNFVRTIAAGEYSPAVSAALKAAEAELEQLRVMSQAHPRPARKASTEPVARRVERMRERLAKGGEVARSVLRELFPESIWLQADVSGTGKPFFWAIFDDGVPAALFDFGDIASQFPIEESDATIGKVGESGSGA